MSFRSKVVPAILHVGTALSALAANVSEATQVSTDATTNTIKPEITINTLKGLEDRVYSNLFYQLRGRINSLTLYKSSTGKLFAQHNPIHHIDLITIIYHIGPLTALVFNDVLRRKSRMSLKQLLIPVGAALAALLPNPSDAANGPIEAPTDLLKHHDTQKASPKLISRILRELTYKIGNDAHALTLHKSPSGAIFAQHGSHASHSSHGSHGSHRSGY
jgi:hypothetical protein